MQHRSFKMKTVIFALIAIHTLAVHSLNKLPSIDKKPHIILIVADDLGFNDVPWHNKDVIAPNIKSLAENGIILEQSYVQPICSPTRSALMTGKYPFTIGRQGNVIWPLMPTGLTLKSNIIPQLLKPLGYSTHAIGKWHLGFCKWEYTPTERGFDTFRGYYTGSEDYYSHVRRYFDKTRHCNETLKANGPKLSQKTFEGYDFRDNKEPYWNASGHYSTYEFATHAEDLLRSSDPSVPKFFYMAFQSVHSPLEVPVNYTKPYMKIKHQNRRKYLGMVTAMDEAIGRIVKALKDTQHYDDSIIIFTTDNGGPTISGGNNWPLRGNKTTMWEGGTRGAAFVHSPRIPNSGTKSNNLIHVTDWMSTIVNLAGGSPPTDTDSLNQWSALIGKSPAPREEFIYDFINEQPKGLRAAIRYKEYKLVLGDPGPGEWTPPPIMRKKKSDRLQFNSMSFQDHYNMVARQKKLCKNERCLKKLLRSYEFQMSRNDISNETEKSLRKLLKTELKNHKTKRSAPEYSLENSELGEIELENVTNLQETSTNSNYLNYFDLFNLQEIDVRLYHLKDDPEERVNLFSKHKNIAAKLTQKLMTYYNRYVHPDFPPNDPNGSPKHWEGIWSPGWC